ncbi:hypothetical protein CARN8_910002 [mine drainage metagenome]|uniref:Uncharacterized protein n=1 Tax=mine drainage metagenome TaxID=410659 RepID=A0A3P3ZS36_9ZZZZ
MDPAPVISVAWASQADTHKTLAAIQERKRNRIVMKISVEKIARVREQGNYQI